MPAGLTNLHIDTFLTGAAAGYSNEDYMAKSVIEVIPSSKEIGKIAAYGNEHYRLDFLERARGGDTPRVDWQAGTPISFAAHEWTIEKPIDVRDAALYDDPFDAERDATFNVMQRLNLKMEFLVGTLMSTSGNFGSTTAGNAWVTPGTGTPITNIRAAMEAVRARTGRGTLYGCCSSSVWNKLIQTTEVKALFTSTLPGAAGPARLTPALVASVLDLKDIYVGPAVYLTSAEGATDVFADAWGTTTFAVYAKAQSGAPASPFNTGFAHLIVPTVPEMPGAEVAIDKYYDNRSKSTVVRGTAFYDQIAVNAKLGQLITGIT